MIAGKAASRRSSKKTAGFTLIELMVAMLLGLVVIGGVISIFLANLNAYNTNQALGDVQNEARTAFELMARDIRNAGLTGCNNSASVGNVLKNGPNATGTKAWWADLNNAVVGYDPGQTDQAIDTAMPARASSTASIELVGGADTGLSIASDNETSQTFTFNESTSNLQAGDVLIVCDPNHTTVFQATSYGGSPLTVTHTVGTGTPGNCSNGLGYPTVCTTTGQAYTFQANAMVAQLSSVDWYVGASTASSGTSLYRVYLAPTGTTLAPAVAEMVPNVTDMRISYLQSPNTTFGSAASVTNWGLVTAVRVTLTMQSPDKRAGTNTQPISRTFVATTTIRNRVL